MNDSWDGLNDDNSREQPIFQHERQQTIVFTDFDSGGKLPHGLSTWCFAAAIVVFFWLAQFIDRTFFTYLSVTADFSAQILPRALICTAGAVVSLGFIFAQNRLEHSTLRVRALWAIALAVAGVLVHALINHVTFWMLMPSSRDGSPFWEVYALEVLGRLWVFACLSAIILAIFYSKDIRDKEHRIQGLQSLAQKAQLRALRSQLNPHFLFNVLNSIAALISSDRKHDAEAITENLSDFLRTTLAIDPQGLISLAEEVRLQKLYLDIQQLRFPDRLAVEFHVPQELQQACVPNLITQPLIENSIKYAVARSTQKVRLDIQARQVGGRLELVVEDDGGNAQGKPQPGAKLGLMNVSERLRAHFGAEAELRVEGSEGGGFRNLLILPLERI